MDKTLRLLAHKFVENCGISAGLRTLYWDMAVSYALHKGLTIKDVENEIAKIDPEALGYKVIPLRDEEYEELYAMALEELFEDEKEIIRNAWKVFEKCKEWGLGR